MTPTDEKLIEAKARLEAALERADRHRVIAVRVMDDDLRLILQALAGEGGKVEGEVRIPQSVAEAETMEKVGYAWLAAHAPERLTDIAKTIATQSAQLARMAEALKEIASEEFEGPPGFCIYAAAANELKRQQEIAARAISELKG